MTLFNEPDRPPPRRPRDAAPDREPARLHHLYHRGTCTRCGEPWSMAGRRAPCTPAPERTDTP